MPKAYISSQDIPVPRQKNSAARQHSAPLGTPKQHGRICHRTSRPRYACPRAEELNCAKNFADQRKANRHARDVHPEGERERHTCPLAKEEKCEKTFLYATTAIQHAAAAHGYGQQYPCPYGSEYDCSQVFGSKGSANRHGETHLERKFPCPLAAEYGCENAFSREDVAKNHAKFHTHPFVCSRQACTERFETVKDAWAHESRPDHVSTSKLFLCTVPMCRRAVSRRGLMEKSVPAHMDMHVSHGHVQDQVQYLPQQVDETFRQSVHSLYWQIRARNHIMEAKNREDLGGSCEVTGASVAEENDFKDTVVASEENDESHGALFAILVEEPASLHSGPMPEERRLCILKQNIVLWGLYTPSKNS